MKKSTKVILGVLTFIPVSYLMIALGEISISVVTGMNSKIFLNVVLMNVAGYYRILLTVSYLVLALVNKKSGYRILWFFVILVGNIFIAPFYWYLYIWKDDMYAVSND